MPGQFPEPIKEYVCRVETHRAGEIPLWLFRPEGKQNRTTVFLLHGLTSRKERHLEWALQLVDAGFIACVFDLRGHGERWNEDSPTLTGDQTTPAFASAFARVTAGTVGDVSAVANYLGLERFGLLGHSFGGYIALQSALVEPRVAAVANASGSIEASGIIEGIIVPDVTMNATRLVPRPILILHGDEDTLVPVEGARRFYQAFTRAYGPSADQVRYVEYPGVGHELLPEQRREAVDFFCRTLGGV